MLDEIIAGVRTGVKKRATKKSLDFLKKKAAGSPDPRNFASAIAPSATLRIIAEIKRASPSAGPLRPDLSPAKLARDYQKAGACAISVLTEENYFHGTLKDLRTVKNSTTIPVLQKEFIIDPYQVYEARYFGADAVLLITALLDRKLLGELYDLSLSLGLAALVEIHNESELEIALSAGAKIIGINNRNLKTLQVSLETSYRILPLVPKDRIVVCESGLKTKEELLELKNLGASAFLIGETLLRQPDPAAALTSLIR